MRLLAGEPASPARARLVEHVESCELCQVVLAAGAGHAGSTLEPGAEVGRYRIEAVLGRGAAGTVYSALDLTLRRRVALKVLRPRDLSPAELERRSTMEARALARLSHRSVVTVYELGVLDGSIWVAMELVEGQSLAEWMRARPTWREVVRVFRAAGAGLAAAHDAGLVHRDFKPANVLVSASGEVRVTDFGLARDADAVEPAAPAANEDALPQGALTREGSLVGTPAYMAPELLRGEHGTPASDQFAFCVALHQALFGDLPFPGDLDEQLERKSATPALPSRPASGVPRRIVRALQRGLAHAPGERHTSMHALLAELKAAGRPGSAVLALAGLVVVTVAVGAGLVLGPRVRCASAADTLTAVWSPEVREQLRAALGQSSYAETVAARVLPQLDAWASDWRALRTQACLDRAPRLEACLDAQLEQLGAVTDVLRASEPAAAHATEAVAPLGSPSACRDAKGLAIPDVPAEASRPAVRAARRELARVSALSAFGRFADGVAAVRVLRPAVRATGFEPLEAEVELAFGTLLRRSGRAADAEAVLRRAIARAEGANDRITAARAWVELVACVGDGLAKRAELPRLVADARAAVERTGLQPLGFELDLALGRAFIQVAQLDDAGQALDAAAKRAPPKSLELADLTYEQGRLAARRVKKKEAGELYRAAIALRSELLGADHPGLAPAYNALANSEEWLNHLDGAVAAWSRAIELAGATGAGDDRTLGSALSNLASFESKFGKLERARELFERAQPLLEKTLGVDHPTAAITLMQRALLEREDQQTELANRLADDAVARVERSQGPQSARLGTVLRERALIRLLSGGLDAADADARRALAVIDAANGPKSATRTSYLRLVARIAVARGGAKGAEMLCEQALELDTAVQGAASGDAARDFTCLGEVQLALGREREAALSLLKAHELRGPAPRDPMESGLATFLLARALWSTQRAEAVRYLEESQRALGALGRRTELDQQQIAAWRRERGL
ncbi:MAG: serine/threonine protein kinase [Myxococcaceae bacterium]|nr:serine/threonine protein kinase [Myxococcaceae bacterium]